MNILPVANVINNKYFPKKNSKSPSLRLHSLNCDTVSFCGKKDYKAQIRQLDEESFPSAGLREYILSNLNEPDKTVSDLHKEYYSKLLECETLDEIKELYPEFKDVIDAKDINISKTSNNSGFRHIQRGEYEGLTLENTSIEMLKRFYGLLLAPSHKEEYFNLSANSTLDIFQKLNIKTYNEYFRILCHEKRSVTTKSTWQNEQRRQTLSESTKARWQNEDFKQAQAQKMHTIWQNEKYRQAHSEEMKKRWENEDFRQMQVQKLKTLWQNEDYRKKMEIVYKAAKEAHNIHPYAKEACKKVASHYPGLKEIAEKKKKHIPLTEEESRTLSLYYKELHKKYPKLQKEIAEIQKQLLREWGFYDSKDDEAIIESLNLLSNKE